jgi:hypothetical protein
VILVLVVSCWMFVVSLVVGLCLAARSGDERQRAFGLPAGEPAAPRALRTPEAPRAGGRAEHRREAVGGALR